MSFIVKTFIFQNKFFKFLFIYFFFLFSTFCCHKKWQDGRGLDPQLELPVPPRLRLHRRAHHQEQRRAAHQEGREPCHPSGCSVRTTTTATATSAPAQQLHLLRGCFQWLKGKLEIWFKVMGTTQNNLSQSRLAVISSTNVTSTYAY